MSRNEFLTIKWAIKELRYYLFPFHNCDRPYSNTVNDKGKHTNAREFNGVWPFRTGKERAQHNTTCLILLCFSSDVLETKEDKNPWKHCTLPVSWAGHCSATSEDFTKQDSSPPKLVTVSPLFFGYFSLSFCTKGPLSTIIVNKCMFFIV